MSTAAAQPAQKVSEVRCATPPVFIVGSPRSGTTLLQSMISSSRELAIAPEHDFLLRFNAAFSGRDFRDRATRSALVDKFFALAATRYWRLDRAGLLDALDAAEPRTYADAVRAIYAFFAVRAGAQCWGAKVPFFALHLDLLRRLFPDVGVIHIVRDGRDVLASMRERSRQGSRHFPTDARLTALRWRQLVLGGTRGRHVLPRDRYLELRYEDLISDTRSTLRLLEGFLGCELATAAEHHYSNALTGAVVHSDQIDRYLRSGIRPESVARWRHDLSPRDVRWFEAIAGDTLRGKGYPTGFYGKPRTLWMAGRCITTGYFAYRRLPRWIKPTLRQHVS